MTEVEAAAIKSRRDGTVLVVTMTGLLTIDVLKQLIVLLVAEDRRKARPTAAVVDLRRAVICVGPMDWAASAKSNSEQGVRYPMAALVSPANFEPAKLHCWNMAKRGLVRAAFVDMNEAITWAAECREWTFSQREA